MTETNFLLVGGVSRSGTTLLSSVLAAHSQIAGAAELIPPPIPSLDSFQAGLREAMAATPDVAQVGRTMRKLGHGVEGKIATRFYRAGFSVEDMLALIERFKRDNRQSSIKSALERIEFASTAMGMRAGREGKPWASFKLNMPSIAMALKAYPTMYIACMVRHPGDVLYSQLSKGFSDDPDKARFGWENYCRNVLAARAKFPRRCFVVRFESLVSQPEETLVDLFDNLPLDFEAQMLRYETGAPTTLTDGHPNAADLAKGFDAGFVGAGRGKLPPDAARSLASIDAGYLKEFGYHLE